MRKPAVLLVVGLGVAVAGCGDGVDRASGPADADAVAHDLAVQACGSVAPHGAAQDLGARELRRLSRAYGDAVDPVIRALVQDPENTDYTDLVSAMGLAEVTWESAAEVVETHGEDTSTWDAETAGDFDRLVARGLDYEAEVDAVCRGYG